MTNAYESKNQNKLWDISVQNVITQLTKFGEMRATAGTLSKIFDVQNKKFTSVTCKKCSYTEFFKAKTSAMSNIFDLFTN